MRATGITRNVDDLGRVVIPVELRRNLDLSEGTPIEIFTDGNSIVLRKYQPVNESKLRTQFELEKLIGDLPTEAQKQVVQAAIELLKG